MHSSDIATIKTILALATWERLIFRFYPSVRANSGELMPASHPLKRHWAHIRRWSHNLLRYCGASQKVELIRLCRIRADSVTGCVRLYARHRRTGLGDDGLAASQPWFLPPHPPPVPPRHHARRGGTVSEHIRNECPPISGAPAQSWTHRSTVYTAISGATFRIVTSPVTIKTGRSRPIYAPARKPQFARAAPG